jgi:hypothetical protein
MRMTYDLLHKYARDTIKMRERSEPDLHAAYLIGSLLGDDPFMGGAADIDLVLVHRFQIPAEREMIPLTPEVSLDIRHKLKEDYEPHRKLRQDPWLGYPLTQSHILLSDTDHWLEFIQAGVGADFHSPENVFARSNALLESAREDWFALLQSPPEGYPAWIQHYLQILTECANALTGLISPPLTTRRFLKDFNDRVMALGVPKSLIGFYGLLGGLEFEPEQLREWVDAYDADLSNCLEEKLPFELPPCRHAYYLNAIRALAADEETQLEAVWPLITTWTDLINASGEEESSAWQNCLETLELDKDHLEQKTEALDAYLDSLEVILESWAEEYV